MAPSLFRCLLVLCMVAVGIHAVTPSAYLTDADRQRLKSVFTSAYPYQDAAAVHYSVLGLKLLEQTVSNAQEVCSVLKTKADFTNVESIYYVSSTSKSLQNCQVAVPATAQKTLNDALTETASVQDLFYVSFSLKNLGYKIDAAKISKLLNAALKKEDSVLNLGYSFHIATLLPDPNPLFERIEDAVVQADEVDGRFAQFEGGLSITAIVVSGIYKLAEHVKKAPAVPADKCTNFANYFISRKHVQVPRAAYHLLDVLNILSNNKFQMPVAITLASKTAVSNSEPIVQIRVTNLLGASLGSLKATIGRAVGPNDAVVLKDAAMLEVKSDKRLYEINFMQNKPGCGFYKLHVNAIPAKSDNRLVGNKDAVLEVKVMTEVSVEELEVGTADVDQTIAPSLHKVQYPNKLQKFLEADYHQKLQMKFSLKDKNAKKLMVAHQVFVRLVNKNTKQEIVFVAEADSSNIYRFDLDLSSKSKELGSISGGYQLDLIVGDAVLSNPFSWTIAEVELTFPETTTPSISKSSEFQYVPKPEIKHIFRQPEKRPSAIVSNSFTALTLAPLLLLIILWIKIGINLSNFQCNVGTIGFHLGLSGVFCLFIVFWMKMDMFTTLKYLVLIGTATFLCGNSMLSKIAANRK